MHRFATKEEGGAGVVIVQLTSSWDPATNVQWVRAEMAVRDGSYVTSQDVHLRMRGVYVEPTGHVHLVSESTLDHAFRGTDEEGDEEAGGATFDWVTAFPGLRIERLCESRAATSWVCRSPRR